MFKLIFLLGVVGYCIGADEPKDGKMTLTVGPAQGELKFTKTDNGICITGKITGLAEGLHGFHVHQNSKLDGNCTNAGGHFNPFNKTHGAPEDQERHVGDLGNIVANKDGVAVVNITDKIISFSGDTNIIGRSIVVHEKADDLGKGGDEGSKTTGNAGGRVGCGVIEPNSAILKTPAPLMLTVAAIMTLLLRSY